uniref:Uncharacterized protein n=1 Tax=Globodera rostochiensis TaxID=31243 RepID=A0A914HEJ6_GLORO
MQTAKMTALRFPDEKKFKYCLKRLYPNVCPQTSALLYPNVCPQTTVLKRPSNDLFNECSLIDYINKRNFMNAEESSQSEPNAKEKDESCQSSGQIKGVMFLGRTLSASAADFERKRKGTATSVPPTQTNLFQFSFGTDHQSPVRHSIIGMKRKYSSQEYSSSSSPIKVLPNFTSTFPSDLTNAQVLKPKPTVVEHFPSPNSEFITPNQPKKQQSRPNSPSNAGSRLIPPRSRLASIQAAHEKLMKSAQQVAMGFEDFCLDDKLFEERKRAKSLTEPISIFTSAFLPQSSSPSPSRGCVDGQKQCYSPSAQQVVRSNLAYSPSPSPTPASSPSMHRMRSMSPIAVRQIAKRRYTGSSNGNCGNGNVSGLESDGEGSASSFSHSTPAPKRQCTTPKNNSNSSPLVRDPTTNLLPQQSPLLSSSSSSSMADFFSASNPSYSAVSNLSARFGPLHSARFLVDPNLTHFPPSSFHGQEEENMGEEEDEPRDNPLMSSFCSSSMFIDANSSTTFSSRANTPESSQYGVDNDHSSTSLFPPPPPHSTCSSDGTSSNCSTSQLLTNSDHNSNSTCKPTGFGLLPGEEAIKDNTNGKMS